MTEIDRAALAAGLTVDDVDNWSATADNYKGRRDIEAAFRTIEPNGGTGAGTLFHKARQYGFDSARNSVPNPSAAKPEKTRQKADKPRQGLNPVEVWNLCFPATPDEAYIYLKQGKPDGLRVYPASAPTLLIGKGDDQINAAGGLVVPCYAPNGETLLTLQIIPLAGAKKNLPGAQFGNGFFTVGEITDRVYICEGIGQAWACKAATGAAAVCCFGAGRMNAVALALREKYPAARLVIVPDKGKEEQAATIAAAVAGQWVAMPADKPSNYDANDFAADHGSEALAALLERPQALPMRFNLNTVHIA